MMLQQKKNAWVFAEDGDKNIVCEQTLKHDG